MTEHHLEFLSLKVGCTGSSESTLVKMPHCWKSHVTTQMLFIWTFIQILFFIRFKFQHIIVPAPLSSISNKLIDVT